MNYLNFYSMLREKDFEKVKSIFSEKSFIHSDSIYNFLFIVDSKILTIDDNPFSFL